MTPSCSPPSSGRAEWHGECWMPGYPGLPGLTWCWEEGTGTVVMAAIGAISPHVTHPLQTLASSILAELSGPTGVCRHSTMAVPLPVLPPCCPPPPPCCVQGHQLSVALKARKVAEKPPLLMPRSVLSSTASSWCEEMRRGGGSAPQNLPKAETHPGHGPLAEPMTH